MQFVASHFLSFLKYKTFILLQRKIVPLTGKLEYLGAQEYLPISSSAFHKVLLILI